MTPFYVVLGVVAVAGVALIAWQAANKQEPTVAPVAVEMTPEQLNRVPGIAAGDPDAPVEIWEFADFQCPGCGEFARFVAPLLKQRYVESGQVRFVFRDFPLVSIHPNAFLAARAGRCANEQERFWEYHDLLFGSQSRWSAETEPADVFVDLAGQAGLDEGGFEECLRSDRYAREVTESMRLAESLGVQGTPTLFINGRKIQNVELANFRSLDALIQQELQGGAAPADTTAAAPAAG